MASSQALKSPVAPPLLDACSLPAAWRGAAAWRILDTDFGDGVAFFQTWAGWAADDDGPRLLHYVAVTAEAPGVARLRDGLAAHGPLAGHTEEFVRQVFSLLPGFHRIVLHGGQVLLTLCIGPLQAMLREQRFLADSVYVPQPALLLDQWHVKALARLCRRGSGLSLCTGPSWEPCMAMLQQAGFGQGTDPAPQMQAMHYAPHWPDANTRDPWRRVAPTPSTCVVVGAGLAGAAAAAALAQRGWQVQVVDQAPQPACGASGLPVGLMVPAVSRDDAPRSRLVRAGMRLTLEACRSRLQEGMDFRFSGVLALQDPAQAALPPAWPAEGAPWARERGIHPEEQAWTTGLAPGSTGLWHDHAGWIKPGALVRALLSHPGICFTGNCRVARAEHVAGQWLLRDAEGKVLATAAQLVIANANDAVQLANHAASADGNREANGKKDSCDGALALAPTQAVGGQMSWGLQSHADTTLFPPFAVGGAGHFAGHIPTPHGPAWFTGATYTRQPQQHNPQEEDQTTRVAHAHNLERLAKLLPATAQQLAGRFDAGEVSAWSAERCTTADRLPAVGPLQQGTAPSLWLSAGMGSRGLSFALLCAELLAAELCAEPLPVEASLAKSLRATRPLLLRTPLHHL